MSDILPDCRARNGGTILMGPAGAWVPVFCGNCGHEGPMVPEQNMTFAFWLCRQCEAKWGAIAGTMIMPDEIFFEQLRLEQLESHGRYLTEDELVEIVKADASPLATLINERRLTGGG